MRAFDRLLARPWITAAVVFVLLGAHALAFYFLRHLVLSATLASIVIIIVAIKHLGLLSSAIAGLRRRH